VRVGGRRPDDDDDPDVRRGRRSRKDGSTKGQQGDKQGEHVSAGPKHCSQHRTLAGVTEAMKPGTDERRMARAAFMIEGLAA